MIVVHIHHFLDNQGERYFPDWLRRAAKTLDRFDGFIDLCELRDVNQTPGCHLLMRFETLDDLKNWSSSPEHEMLLSELQPYTQRPQESETFEAGPSLPAGKS